MSAIGWSDSCCVHVGLGLKDQSGFGALAVEDAKQSIQASGQRPGRVGYCLEQEP